MKPVFFFLFIMMISNCFSQKQYLAIASQSAEEQKTIDSIGYDKKYDDAKAVADQVKLFAEKLNQSGYIESEIETSRKTNDSTFLYQFRLGKKIDFIHIYIGKDSALGKLSGGDFKNDTLILPYHQIEGYIKKTLAQLEKQGFALSKLRLINIKKKWQPPNGRAFCAD